MHKTDLQILFSAHGRLMGASKVLVMSPGENEPTPTAGSARTQLLEHAHKSQLPLSTRATYRRTSCPQGCLTERLTPPRGPRATAAFLGVTRVTGHRGPTCRRRCATWAQNSHITKMSVGGGGREHVSKGFNTFIGSQEKKKINIFELL